ncbi:MAG TPA: ABC transporter permease [Lachnospiraceae bacterium]|nr:ABC transporter permease [Lachnospiraceae bacterium]
MSKVKRIVLTSPVMWPAVGSIVLFVMICMISGGVRLNVLSAAAKLCVFTMLLGIAQMIVVTSGRGAIDISQKYILTLTAYISCELMQYNILLGIIVAVIVGMICGLINSCVNQFLNIHAMITTMATGYLYYTIILLISNKVSNSPNSSFVKFTNASFLGFNTMTIIVVAVAAALFFVLYKTKYGMNLHASGQKRDAARLAGIDVKKTVIIAFVINGGLCGLAGVLNAAYCGGANQDLGTTYFLPSIAACFVGGTNAGGGRSNIIAVCLGAFMMTLMSTFLNAAKISIGGQRLIQGVFIVLLLVAATRTPKNK